MIAIESKTAFHLASRSIRSSEKLNILVTGLELKIEKNLVLFMPNWRKFRIYEIFSIL